MEVRRRATASTRPRTSSDCTRLGPRLACDRTYWRGQLEPLSRDLAGTTRELVRSLFPADAEESLVEWAEADMAAAPRAVALGALESSFTDGRR